MRSRNLAWIAVAGGVALGGCSPSPSNTGGFLGSGGNSGSGGSTGSGGATTGSGGTTIGSGGVTGSGGAIRSGGATGSGGITPTGGSTATGGSTGSGGVAQGGSTGAGGAGGISAVLASPGCNKTPPTSTMGTIGTTTYGRFSLPIMAQSVLQFNAATPPGSGPNTAYTRQYYVRLPDNYDNTRPYRVVYLGPGCSQQQDTLMPQTPIGQPPLDSDPSTMAAARTGAILVQMQQGTYNPAAYNAVDCRISNTQGCNATSAYCFDDWASEAMTPMTTSIPDGTNGAVAMEKAYFGALHQAIENNYCVDKNRQFYGGYSSGGWLAQQLGCWFSDVLRAQANDTGGIPPIINANANPPGPNNYCVKHPIAYMSLHNNPDMSNGFQGSLDGARRVFALNQCTGTFPIPPLPTAATIPTGLEAYQVTNAAGTVVIANSPTFRCYHFTTCPPAYPMYFCVSTDASNNGHDAQSNREAPAFWQFFTRF